MPISLHSKRVPACQVTFLKEVVGDRGYGTPKSAKLSKVVGAYTLVSRRHESGQVWGLLRERSNGEKELPSGWESPRRQRRNSLGSRDSKGGIIDTPDSTFLELLMSTQTRNRMTSDTEACNDFPMSTGLRAVRFGLCYTDLQSLQATA